MGKAKIAEKPKTTNAPVRYIAIPLQGVTTDTPLPYPLYVKVAGRYVLFRPQGDELTPERKQDLLSHIDTIFITHHFWDTYLSSMSKIVFKVGDRAVDKSSTSVKELKGQDKSVFLERHQELEEAILRARQVLLALLSDLENEWSVTPDSLQYLRELSSAIGEFIHKAPQFARRLVWSSDSVEARIASHMVNVAVYAAAIGARNGLDNPQMEKLIFACMVHDIGKFTLPKELFYKPSLTIKERALVRTHSDSGARLLEKVFKDPIICIPALQHHERSDGSGFPAGLTDSKIHLFAKICMVADVFDSLTRPRPYREVIYKPEVAIEMMRHMRHRFDPAIFLA